MGLYRKIHSEEDTYIEYIQRIYQARSYVVPIIQKDLKLRYSQTSLGIVWTVLGPFLSIFLYVVFFGWVLKISIEGTSYILFVLSGFAFWNILSGSCTQVGNALIQNQELIKKIPIPKIIIPFSKAITVWIESSLLLAIAISVSFFKHGVHWDRVVFLPLLMIALFLFASALGLLISSLTIYKRDILYGFPMLLQLLIWFTPVFYPIQILPEYLKPIVAFNPFSGYIEVFRWTLGMHPHIAIESFWSILFSLFIALCGFIFFKKKEEVIVNYF